MGPASADSTVTVLSLMMMLGSIPMVLLSDKLKTRKGVLVICIGALVMCLALLPYVNSTGVWILIAASGFLRSGSGSIFNVMIFEMKGVGATYGGTAIGLSSTISMIGACFAPPIGNKLGDFYAPLPFLFWGFLALIGIFLLPLIKTEKKPVSPYLQQS